MKLFCKMITRRDKLLNKPWEQRRYDNHIRKVQSAIPVIDNKPPISREHVSIKSKKHQKEIERMRKIESDNLILLRRINYVMSTNRVDNWNIPNQQAKYLNRVPMQYPSRPVSHSEIVNKNSRNHALDANHNHIRKSKCNACSPNTILVKEFDSERMPWEEKQPYSINKIRERSKSLPVIKARNTRNNGAIAFSKTRTELHATSNKVPDSRKSAQLQEFKSDPAQKLIISRGSLQLCVKFPPDSQIKLKNGCVEKIVFGNHNNCACKI